MRTLAAILLLLAASVGLAKKQTPPSLHMDCQIGGIATPPSDGFVAYGANCVVSTSTGQKFSAAQVQVYP